MSCKGEAVLRAEEVLLLFPSNLFKEVFLDCIGPFPQNYRGCSYYDHEPRMWYALNHYDSIKKPSDDASVGRIKPRGTGVFLPPRPMSSSEEKKPKKKPCPIISSPSKQVFLPLLASNLEVFLTSNLRSTRTFTISRLLNSSRLSGRDNTYKNHYYASNRKLKADTRHIH